MAAASTLNRIAREVRALPRQITDDNTKRLQRAATKSMTRDTGGDRSLSNAPVKLKVSRKVSGDRVVTGLVTADPPRGRGPWSWMQYGTAPHLIPRGNTVIQHPGTSGKETWTRAVDPELAQLVQDNVRAFQRAMRR